MSEPASRRYWLYAIVGSFLLHSLLLIGVGWSLAREAFENHSVQSAPLTLNIVEPPPQPPPRQIVDVATPSAEPPKEPANRIAEENSRASDVVARNEPGELGPKLEEEAPYDSLPRPAPSQPTPQPALPPPSAPPAAPRTRAREQKQPEGEPGAEEETGNAEPEPVPEPAPRREPKRPAEQAPRKSPRAEIEESDRAQVARAAPDALPESAAQSQAAPTADDGAAPPVPSERPPAPGRGRSGSRAEVIGQVGFEANKDAVAAYLKHVRDCVERKWNQLLGSRYTGTRRTDAVLYCAIAPDGTVKVKIEDSGGDALFAALCKEAIERAAPFEKFPFTTPQIYRSANIEIRWTFNYL